MSKVCILCGKGKMTGNTVSHSHIGTKRTYNANLVKSTVEVDGKTVKGYVCTKCKKGSKKDK